MALFQNDLDAVYNWSQTDDMKFNAAKGNVIVFYPDGGRFLHNII